MKFLFKKGNKLGFKKGNIPYDIKKRKALAISKAQRGRRSIFKGIKKMTPCANCHYKITFGKPMPPKVRAWGHNLLKGGKYL